MISLNANEILFLRWMRSECDWGQISYMADHDEYSHIDPDKRWETIRDEIKWAIQAAIEEDVFDRDFLSKIDPNSIADVIWDDDCDKYLGASEPSEVQCEKPERLFTKARIKKNWKYVTFDCVGLSVKDEPGLRQFSHLIEGAKTIVHAVLGKACKIIEVKAIH